ncbi:MAG TPA: phosphate-starvation-inducible PsiE family protein [Thermodesulfobacteriota bacterium]|nr:phosphate-starvation-inducible PsiE family protein [Thermodesulfobacteriota bacterium]
MFDYLKKLEKFLIHALMVMMALVLLLATVELGWIIVKDIFSPPVFLLEIEELLDIFGLFMLVIIGIELLETIMKTYLKENVNHVEVVFLVAMIAIARKVIILDVKDVSGVTLVGIGAIVITLSAGYYLIRRKDNSEGQYLLDQKSKDDG